MTELSTRFKKFLFNMLGVITTVIGLAVIYLVLYTTGTITKITVSTVIEFITITVIAIYTKTFWYTDAEYKIKASDVYIDKRKTVVEELNNITDIHDFDKYIEVQNIMNYNKYMSNKCKMLTLKNFRPNFGWQLVNLIRTIFGLEPFSNLELFNKRICRYERRANRLHKLSSSAILTLSESQLVDDRNYAGKRRFEYIIFGSIVSIAILLFTAIVGFKSREDIDTLATATKLVIYAATILCNIVMTVITAQLTVENEDYSYFRRILNICDGYAKYREQPFTVSKDTYILTEDDYGNNTSNAEQVSTDRNI